jgi:chromosome partitioning protein
MAVLVVGAIKGGSGKTTLATNITIALALAGKSVLLVDGDEQRTAMTFTELRTELLGHPGYTAIRLDGISIRHQVRQLAGKYDEVVIDVGGRETNSLRAALTIADWVLIPVQPRSYDLWALDQMMLLVEEAHTPNEKLQALAVLNQADPVGRDNEDTAELIASTPGLTLLKGVIGRRKVFPNAGTAGRSVIEHLPRDQKAIDELNQLVQAIYRK